MEEYLEDELRLWTVHHSNTSGLWASVHTEGWPCAGASVSLFRHGHGPSVIVGFHTGGIRWSLQAFLPESMDELKAALFRVEPGQLVAEMALEELALNWMLDRLAAAEVVMDALLGSREEAEHAV